MPFSQATNSCIKLQSKFSGHIQGSSDVINRLGGMHTLMSFAGAVGTLMVLEATFVGVTKMLSGKKFPQNIRAMRLVL